jgi:hypothetical protein
MGMIMADSRGFVPVLRARPVTPAVKSSLTAAAAVAAATRVRRAPARLCAYRRRLTAHETTGLIPTRHQLRRAQTNTVVILYNRVIRQLS